MQFWPRKRASRPYARIRAFQEGGQGLLAFAGYKAGMTHVQAIDTDKNSQTKNEIITLPVTVIECPPLRVYGVRAYTHDVRGLRVAQEFVVAGKDKHLARKTNAKSSPIPDSFSPASFDKIRVIVMTQPSMTGIGQKKPQLFEVDVGGKDATAQFETAKALVGRDIKASEFFKEGEYVDVHAITTGRGYQGPVKRFGIGLKGHKSEKGRRRPGSLGGWSAQQHVMYRVAFAGQMGFHQRVQYNNQILKITQKPEDVNVHGGFLHYGTVRAGNEFVLVQGSVPGAKKRLVTLVKAIRLKAVHSVPTVETISLESKQGK
jgi:large subunit ribosomal protein L3